jgi:hypothetical protein
MKILFLILLIGVAVFAAGQDKPPRQIHEKGRVESGVEAGCLLLVTLDGKTTYNIMVAQNPPKVGDRIEIWGKEYRGPTTCMQGTAVNVEKWARIKEKSN